MEPSPFVYWLSAAAGLVALFVFRRLRRMYVGDPGLAALLFVVLLAVLVSWQVALTALATIVVLSYMRAYLRQANTRHG